MTDQFNELWQKAHKWMPPALLQLRVRETHEPFRFNPMAARERRIIHLVLKDQPGIRTTSEGNGEMRQVVVFPAG